MIIVPTSTSSQRQKILAMLVDHHSVTSAQLNKVCFRYSARIHELRKQGHAITSKQISKGLWEYTYEGRQ